MQGIIPDSKEQDSPIGYIKIGGTKEITKNGKTVTIPESYDYFKATGRYQNYFTEAFGDNPNSIEITFCSDDFFESFWERYELWGKDGRRWAFGDGTEFMIWDEGKEKYVDKNKIDDKELIESLHKKVNGQWVTLLSITFLIPRIKIAGLWRLNTKGKESSIPSMKKQFKRVLESAGTVSGIPFDLHVEKKISYKPGSKNKFPVLHLTPNLSQPHIEMIKELLPDKKFIGLLTEEKIESLKQIPEIPEEVENTIDAEYQLELEGQNET
jgi:hypothetical protein